MIFFNSNESCIQRQTVVLWSENCFLILIIIQKMNPYSRNRRKVTITDGTKANTSFLLYKTPR